MKKVPTLLLLSLAVLSASCGEKEPDSSESFATSPTGLPSSSSGPAESFPSSSSSISLAAGEGAVVIEETDNGKVQVSETVGKVGDRVEVYVIPDNGYVLDALTVNGLALTLKQKDIYTFVLEEGANVLSASFRKVESTYRPEGDYRLYEVYKKNGTPVLDSLGEQKILVVPVQFSDFPFVQDIKEQLQTAFFGMGPGLGFESVSSYYAKSSYGALHIAGQVTDVFDCGLSTAELLDHASSAPGVNDHGTLYLLDQAVSWCKERYGADLLRDYDQDGDGFVDAVYMIYSAPDYKTAPGVASYLWAFTSSDAGKTEGDVLSPLGNRYSFASYDFMYAGKGYGKDAIDAHTYIHETGHLMGLMDYYDASGLVSPFGESDMMASSVGDMCAYTKYVLGWTKPMVVNGLTLTDYRLQSTTETGDFLLLPVDNGNDLAYNGSPFNEYFLVEFMTPTGLNEKDYTENYETVGNGVRHGYAKPGIRISYVCSFGFDARGNATADYDKTTIVPLSNNTGNFYDSIGNAVYLITMIQKNYQTYSNVLGFNPEAGTGESTEAPYAFSEDELFFAGDTFNLNPSSSYRYLVPSTSATMELGGTFDYTVHVDTIDEDGATLSVYHF